MKARAGASLGTAQVCAVCPSHARESTLEPALSGRCVGGDASSFRSSEDIFMGCFCIGRLHHKVYAVERAIAQREVAVCDSRNPQESSHFALAADVRAEEVALRYILFSWIITVVWRARRASRAVWTGTRGRRCYKATTPEGVPHHD